MNVTWAFDVHEVRVRVLDQTLELVLALFVLGTRMQKVNGELKQIHNFKLFITMLDNWIIYVAEDSRL